MSPENDLQMKFSNDVENYAFVPGREIVPREQ